jgi:hypothetical protein
LIVTRRGGARGAAPATGALGRDASSSERAAAGADAAAAAAAADAAAAAEG